MVSYPTSITGNTTVTGTLEATGRITADASETVIGNVAVQPTNGAATAVSINQGGTQAFDEMRILGDGSYNLGPGTATRDTTLGRAAAGVLYTSKNLLVGSATALGDNGVGEVQLANATTVPTTNPTAGATMYASGGGVFYRDPNGTATAMIRQATAAGSPTGVIASTCHAFDASGTATPASGTLYIHRVNLPIGQVVTSVGFVTGLTAATGPTHWWTALLDNTYKQLAHSADATTSALPASTWQTQTMTTPYTCTYTGAYFLAVMIATSTTQPTLVSTTTVPNAALISGTGLLGPVPGGTSSTGLTTPGTDGTTVYATPTAASNFFYLYAS